MKSLVRIVAVIGVWFILAKISYPVTGRVLSVIPMFILLVLSVSLVWMFVAVSERRAQRRE